MGRDCKEREIEGKLLKGYMHCKKVKICPNIPAI